MTFEIFEIPHDHESARSWLHRVKDFRLLALQTAPDAFLSTYAREVAFTDEVWYDRLTNPDAFTFLALQSSRVVGSLTLLGPLPYLPEEQSLLANPWHPPNGDTPAPVQEPDASHWCINGMFVLSEARGRGAARALIARSMDFGRQRAALSGKDFISSIAVDSDNVPAKSLYEKCGYVSIKSEPLAAGSPRRVLFMKYMTGVGASA
jgi:GNAT superfamily N-acetyltransferase